MPKSALRLVFGHIYLVILFSLKINTNVRQKLRHQSETPKKCNTKVRTPHEGSLLPFLMLLMRFSQLGKASIVFYLSVQPQMNVLIWSAVNHIL